ncbi:ABC transporter permease subunit [Neobacillus notoginsengisoli]|uniref:ABC transporter permease subunit n=1 Tax=Neobacillus notoginsengisoli TaxID=1578198 RepID=A0A417YVI6_9BACI|nr:ABC transporter permease subunit [Neobacillus notoginsengisoli]RHW41289.1 ABC transporter permease subunit [Neobacillus notoginsengisoli]
MIRVFQQALIIIGLILFLAALPSIVMMNHAMQAVEWKFEHVPALFGTFFSNLKDGGLGTYELAGKQRLIAEDIGDNFKTSLSIILAGVGGGVLFSLVFGIFISRFRLTKLFNAFLNILAAIPDFILIIISLILAIKFYKATGIRVVSLRPDAGSLNIWFPMLLTGIAPTLYLFKIVAVKYYQTSGEDFVRTAVAKGLAPNFINFQHVFKNIEPFINAELTKVISLAISNLFIVEYLMNVSGITKFIFQNGDMQPVAIGLFSMLLISFITYITVRVAIFLFKRGFIYE